MTLTRTATSDLSVRVPRAGWVVDESARRLEAYVLAGRPVRAGLFKSLFERVLVEHEGLCLVSDDARRDVDNVFWVCLDPGGSSLLEAGGVYQCVGTPGAMSAGPFAEGGWTSTDAVCFVGTHGGTKLSGEGDLSSWRLSHVLSKVTGRVVDGKVVPMPGVVYVELEPVTRSGAVLLAGDDDYDWCGTVVEAVEGYAQGSKVYCDEAATLRRTRDRDRHVFAFPVESVLGVVE